MKTIRNLLDRNLDKKIEEIIKLDQTDEQSVHTEITEYIITPSIREHYHDLLKAYAEAPAANNEDVGVWISGFFGSGKSSFAKNLGYVLSNREVLGEKAADLFKQQLDRENKDEAKKIGDLIDFINVKIPTDAIMFDVQVDRAVKTATESIAEIMYTVLLRELGYAQDYDIAELEIELENEGKLEQFTTRCNEKYDREWNLIRKGAQKISRASAILHDLDPDTYETADSWSQSLREKKADITVGKFVQRTFELCAKRKPGKALIFIIDEVGQYVARSSEKIENLRVVVEQFGKESKNRIKAKQAVAPVWVIVTSQEKLDEVVAAIDSKRVRLATMQDRFKFRVDLAPADIREVATKRVLAKKEDAVGVLKNLYRASEGALKAGCHLERTKRKTDIDIDDFVQFYPYLPHFIELSIDIMSGIRLQPGAPKHLGGSNRTIIKQTYEMLVSDRTKLADAPTGTLVTFDKIFELVEGNLSSEKQKDVSDITSRFSEGEQTIEERVAKAICLLEFVRDLPRTESNIAATLIARIGDPSPVKEVTQALENLQEAKFVRNTEEGWKLQTAQEKNWETERRSYLEPKPKDRNEIMRDTLEDMFGEPKLKTYKYRDLKSFRVGISVNSVKVGDDGQIPISIITADSPDDLDGKKKDTRSESRLPKPEENNNCFWVFALNAEIDGLAANLYASRQMVSKYDQLRAHNKITNEESACLQSEKHEVMRYQSRLRERTIDAFKCGTGIFRGVDSDGAALGKTHEEIVKNFLDKAVPELYPKLELGSRNLKGKEAEEVLKAANLNGLSTVFYDGEGGLGLVIQKDGHYVPNPNADVAKEVLDYLKGEHEYGNKVTGKDVDANFQGIGYGWDRDMLRLVLAVLLRAGVIEVGHQGRRYRNHSDAQCRTPFSNNTAFRSASFAPRESIGLKILTTAVQHLEDLTGEEVDVEEGAIASAFKKIVDEELELLLPIEATVRAHSLPVSAQLSEYRGTLESAKAAASDDCVRILAGEGKSFREAREAARQIRESVSDTNIATINKAKVAVNRLWPAIKHRDVAPELGEETTELAEMLDSPTFYEHIESIAGTTNEITTNYVARYKELLEQRNKAFSKALDEAKGREEINELSEEMVDSVLTPLQSRILEDDALEAELEQVNAGESTGQYSLSQLDSDLAATQGLKTQVLHRIQELTTPKEEQSKIIKVRLADFFGGPLDSDEAINEAVERLADHLHKLLDEGAKIILE